MKSAIKKFVTALLIVTILFNFTGSNCLPVYGVDDIETAITNVLGGVIGIFTWIPRLIAMALGLVLNVIAAQIAYMDGKTATAGSGSTAVITPFEIFFNEVQLLDVNFLDTSVGGTTGTIRKSVAQWYYVMRLIASIILLVILIFVGIKMAISSVAEEKAIYKKTLVDWATSLALVFLLHYIIMFTVNVNSAIVQAMKSVVDTTGVDDTIKGIALVALGVSWRSMAATIVYFIFVFQTFSFLFAYIKRMLTVGFLIIISPLISITYSIDKMGDGKAQALNAWLKEFIYGVLIQPFHCVMYMAFLDTAFNLLKTSGANDLANAILAIICMMFIDNAEGIIKKIFGFENVSAASPIRTAAAAGMLLKGGQMAMGAATNVRKGINMAKNSGLISAVKKDAIAIKEGAGKAVAGVGNLAQKGAVAAVAMTTGGDKEAAKEKVENTKNQVTNFVKKGKEASTKPIRDLAANVRDAKSEAKNQKRNNAIDAQMEANFGGKENLEKFKSRATDAEWEAARSKAGEQVDSRETARKEKRDETKKKISGAAGTVGKGVGKAASAVHNSNVARYMRTTGIKKMASAGVAIALGSLALGSNGGNFIEAIGVGTTGYKGMQQFTSTSTKTIATNASKYLDGRTSSEEETIQKCEEVYQKGETGGYNSGSDEMKEILNELKSVLNAMGKGNMFNQIRTSIEYQAAKDPSKLDLEGILRKVGDGAEKDPRLLGAAQNFAEFTLDSNLYKQMQNGTAIGMDIDNFAKKLDRMIVHAEPQTTVEEDTEIVEDGNGTETPSTETVQVEAHQIIEHIERNENIETIVNQIDEGNVEQVKQEIERKLQELKTQSEDIQAIISANGESEITRDTLTQIKQETSKFEEVQRQIELKMGRGE